MAPPNTQSLAVSLANGNFNTTSGGEPLINARLGDGRDLIRVDGSAAADTIRFGTLGINLNADSDFDLVFSGVDDFVLRGLSGDDVLSGDGGAGTGSTTTKSRVQWLGGAGADALTGGSGDFDDLRGDADVVRGGPVAGGGNDTISGGAGQDVLHGQTGDDTMSGGAEGDQLFLEVGNDTYSGGDGNDFFVHEYNVGPEADGADRIAGGAGIDFLQLTNRTANVVITLDNVAGAAPAVGNDGADTNADGVADEGDDIRADLEHIVTGAGNDTVNADTVAANARPADNTFWLNGGDDTAKGGDGADLLDGGVGNDTLAGGNGNDTVIGTAGSDTLTGGDGSDTVDGGADSDPLIDGGPGDDLLPQEAAPDGSDNIVGGSGKDFLNVYRAGSVRITLDNAANDGSDVDGNGVAEEADNVHADIERITTSSGSDYVNANTPQANALGTENYIDTGSGNDFLGGGGGDDVLRSGDGDDTLQGDAGEDQMFGRAGLDTFIAKDGYYDVLDGGFGDGVADLVTADSFDFQSYLP